MTHLDEGRLLEVRDGADGATDPAVTSHLGTCTLCRGTLEELQARSTATAAALDLLDGADEPWRIDEARRAVGQRLAEGAAHRFRNTSDGGAVATSTIQRRRRFWTLPKAAVLVLVSAVAASALPRSPIRAWLGELGRDPQPAGTHVAPLPESLTAGETTGVRVRVGSNPFEITARGVAPGGEILVRWVPNQEVSVFAPLGSRFTSGEGHVEAQVTPGAIRVDLPRRGGPLSMTVNGVLYLRRDAASLSVFAPTMERTEDEIRFRVPQRP